MHVLGIGEMENVSKANVPMMSGYMRSREPSRCQLTTDGERGTESFKQLSLVLNLANTVIVGLSDV